jgi:hypothetical protein
MGMYVDSPPPAPEQQTYGESLGEAYDAQLEYAQQLYDMESNPNHGRQAYAELDQKVIKQGLLGKDGTGREGATGLIAGNQKRGFDDGTAKRKAGFSADGEFLGTTQLDQDLKYRQTADSLKQTINLANRNSGALTSAMRMGGVGNAIDDFTALAKRSSNPNDIQVGGDLENKAGFNMSQVKDIQGSQSQQISSVGNARDIGNQYGARQVQGEQMGDLGGLRSAMRNDAMSELQSGGNLSAQELRQVEEDARAGQTARGVARNYSSIVDEVANKESLRRERQNEARNYAGQIAGQEASLRGADVGSSMQAQMANQQSDEAMRQRQMQAQMTNQQKDMSYADRRLQSQMANQQADLASDQLNQQARIANQQVDLQTASAILGGAEKDADMRLHVDQLNRQLDMQALQADRAVSAQRVGLEKATSADPFMAITGRNFSGSQGGQNVYGSGAGLGATPTLYNAGQGIEYMSNANANLANYQANVYGAQAGAQAGMMGALIGAGGSMASAGITRCWVAREVYGENNPMWLLFRDWLDTESPAWFRATYLKFGERFAKFIKNKPRLKRIIRKWMTSKVREVI